MGPRCPSKLGRACCDDLIACAVHAELRCAGLARRGLPRHQRHGLHARPTLANVCQQVSIPGPPSDGLSLTFLQILTQRSGDRDSCQQWRLGVLGVPPIASGIGWSATEPRTHCPFLHWMPRKGHATSNPNPNPNPNPCLLYTSPSPRDGLLSRMPSSA